MAEPGWYPDPAGDEQLRWWDGSQWTEHVAPREVPRAQPAPPALPADAPPAQQRTDPFEPVGTQTSANSPAPASQGNSTVAVGLLDKRRGLFSGKRALEDENLQLRQALESIGLAERDALVREIALLRDERNAIYRELGSLRAVVVETSEAALLQEVGLYEYRHPLDDSAAYKAQLQGISRVTKEMAKTGRAVVGATSWHVNGSAKAGQKMVNEFSKLMLRAYNNEVDNAVRTLKPYALDAALKRIEVSRNTISRLGATMSLSVTEEYHRLRRAELELTADYLAKVAEEKEREREARERARDEERAQREIRKEQERLAKERTHYEQALEALLAKGDHEAAADARAKLAEIDGAVDGLTNRLANTRAGYVYVISNVGAFGGRMVKIGLTRRLDPTERVRELGDASVPFRFDIHATVFDDDAVGLEAMLHEVLADRRVNLVNRQREFFYASPQEVCAHIERLRGHLLHYVEEPEALEWRQSENARRHDPSPTGR